MVRGSERCFEVFWMSEADVLCEVSENPLNAKAISKNARNDGQAQADGLLFLSPFFLVP